MEKTKLKEIIIKADKNKKGLLHINFATLEQIKGIFESVKETKSYLIAAASEGERKYLGTRLVKILVDYSNLFFKERKIFVSADHCHSLKSVREAVESGYDLIVADFSHLSFKKNCQKTKEAVEIAKSIKPDVLVEGEIGKLAGSSEILTKAPKGPYADPKEAKIFAEETKIDLLAPAVGNFHGKVEHFHPKINFDLIKKIKEKTNLPLVLHGGSGIKDSDVKESIKSGITIVHYNTDIREIWRKYLDKSLKENKKEVVPYKILPLVVEEIKKGLEIKIKEFQKGR